MMIDWLFLGDIEKKVRFNTLTNNFYIRYQLHFIYNHKVETKLFKQLYKYFVTDLISRRYSKILKQSFKLIILFLSNLTVNNACFCLFYDKICICKTKFESKVKQEVQKKGNCHIITQAYVGRSNNLDWLLDKYTTSKTVKFQQQKDICQR